MLPLGAHLSAGGVDRLHVLLVVGQAQVGVLLAGQGLLALQHLELAEEGLGQDDLPAGEVRRILGPDKIVGVSAGSVAEAVKAEEDGADYLGVGAMYATSTKEDADVTSREELLRIREAVDLPIVVIGGINRSNYRNFKGIGVNGLAVVSAVIAADDIEAAARELSEGFRS